MNTNKLFLSDVVENPRNFEPIKLQDDNNFNNLKDSYSRYKLTTSTVQYKRQAPQKCPKLNIPKEQSPYLTIYESQQLYEIEKKVKIEEQYSYIQAQNKRIQKRIAQVFVTRGYGSHIARQFVSQNIYSDSYRANLNLIFRKALRKLYQIVSTIRKETLFVSHLKNIDKLIRHLCICKLWMTKTQQQAFHKLIKIVYALDRPIVYQEEMEALYNKIQRKAKEIKNVMKSLEPGKRLIVIKKPSIFPKKQSSPKKDNKLSSVSIRAVQVNIALLYSSYHKQEAVVKVLNQKYTPHKWSVEDIKYELKQIIKMGLQKLLNASVTYSDYRGDFEQIQLSEQQINILINYDHNIQVKTKIALAFATQGRLRHQFVISTLFMISNYLKSFQTKHQTH